MTAGGSSNNEFMTGSPGVEVSVTRYTTVERAGVTAVSSVQTKVLKVQVPGRICVTPGTPGGVMKARMRNN
jgi:hypothetical protein